MLAVLAPLLVVTAAVGAPAKGAYEAKMCVTGSNQQTNCGPADVRLLDDGDLRVQVNDIVYHMTFVGGQLIGVMLHGSVQVGEYMSGYAWRGTTIEFGDAPRGLRYEITLGARHRGAPPQDEASEPAR